MQWPQRYKNVDEIQSLSTFHINEALPQRGTYQVMGRIKRSAKSIGIFELKILIKKYIKILFFIH